MAVSFTSANTRRGWQSALLAMALHIAIAVGIGFAMARSPGQDPWTIAALVYGLFLGVSIVWWATRQIVTWLVWRLMWRRSAVNDLVADFEKAKFPKPDNYLASPQHYLHTIADDPDNDPSIRIVATAHLLRLGEFAPAQGMLVAVRVANLYEEAITEYNRVFRQVP